MGVNFVQFNLPKYVLYGILKIYKRSLLVILPSMIIEIYQLLISQLKDNPACLAGALPSYITGGT